MSSLNNLSNWSLDKRVFNKLNGTGFDTLSGFDKHLCLDLPLIHALISRYDAETRSFKLGSAENPFNIAFGLEDILYLTGLPIDGKPVTGVDFKDKENVCLRYLGKHERHGTGSRSNISLTWLRENFMTLQGDDENLSDEELGYHVRAYVLYAIGCTFAPSTNLMVSHAFLPLLENVDDIGSYAWGAALLANMHDSMENPTAAGFYFPLMIFAYIRFPGLSSTFEIDRAAINAFPLMKSWSHALGFAMRHHFKNQNVKYFETFFDSLKEGGTGEEEVKWQPYGELSGNFLPKHLRDQLVLSKSRGILACKPLHVFAEEARRTEASLIERVLKPRKDNRKNFPEHMNRISRIDNVDVDHQSPGDTTSSRVRNSTAIRSCHPQGVSFLAGIWKVAGNTTARVTASESSSLNIGRGNSENKVSNAATLPVTLTSNIPVPGYKELVNDDTEAGLSTRKKRKKTTCGGSHSSSLLEDLSCEELGGKFSSVCKVVSEKLKQVDSTNKELQQQFIALQSDIQALQAEKQKLEASHSQKDQALMQLQNNHLALKNEVSTLKVQLKQKDERVEEMVASLDQERAAAILNYKASPRFAEEFQIVMAPLLLHGYTLGVDDAKAPDLDIGSLANSSLYKHGQGNETEKRFKELAAGEDIVTMYKPRPPALELDQANVDNVDVDHQSHAGDTASSRVQNPTRRCHPQMDATTATTAGGGNVVRVDPQLIIDIKSESDSDSEVSMTDSLLDSFNCIG